MSTPEEWIAFWESLDQEILELVRSRARYDHLTVLEELAVSWPEMAAQTPDS